MRLLPALVSQVQMVSFVWSSPGHSSQRVKSPVLIQRAFVVTKGETILLSDLPKEIISGKNIAATPSPAPKTPTDNSVSRTLPIGNQAEGIDQLADAMFQWARNHADQPLIPTVERELVKQALKETRGNQVKASTLLGITRATLRKRIEKFNI